MDLIFHALTGFALKWKSRPWQAMLFSILPDILGLGGLFNWLPYHYSHNIFAAALITIITLVLHLPLELSGFYLLHIIIDIFTHGTGTGAFFFPFRDILNYTGINWWQTPWIEITGYAILLAVIFIRYKKREYQNNENSNSNGHKFFGI